MGNSCRKILLFSFPLPFSVVLFNCVMSTLVGRNCCSLLESMLTILSILSFKYLDFKNDHCTVHCEKNKKQNQSSCDKPSSLLADTRKKKKKLALLYLKCSL